MSVLAIVPAKSRSTGIPGKNFRLLGGKPLWRHALDCAEQAECETVVSGDDVSEFITWQDTMADHVLTRPPELAQDDTPMIAVVQHVLEQVPGPEDQIIVLLQPTQPFRTAQHVQQAIALLRETQADSVVSVVELPKTQSPEILARVNYHGDLVPYLYGHNDQHHGWRDIPNRRQDAETAYRRDGTVYAFRRETVADAGNIYGWLVKPLIIPAAETCELDTIEQWAEVERRWHAQR